MNLFVSQVEDIEDAVNEFSELFADLESQDFVNNVILSINNINKYCDHLDNLIYDRIINNIKNNILTSNWMNTVKN